MQPEEGSVPKRPSYKPIKITLSMWLAPAFFDVCQYHTGVRFLSVLHNEQLCRTTEQ